MPFFGGGEEQARTLKSVRDNASISAVGIEIALAVTIGLLGGQWIDSQLDTGALFTILLTCAGFGAAVKAMLRTAKQFEAKLRDSTSPDERPRPVPRNGYDRRWS